VISHNITVATGMKVMPMLNSRRESHGSETFAFYMKEMSLSTAGLVTCSCVSIHCHPSAIDLIIHSNLANQNPKAHYFAYRWVGSYEGLEGGFWTDAIQSFTGGVVERIKLREGNIPENLSDIMLNAYHSGSSLCCIKKVCLCHTLQM
jgi:hypothetical protein